MRLSERKDWLQHNGHMFSLRHVTAVTLVREAHHIHLENETEYGILLSFANSEQADAGMCELEELLMS